MSLGLKNWPRFCLRVLSPLRELCAAGAAAAQPLFGARIRHTNVPPPGNAHSRLRPWPSALVATAASPAREPVARQRGMAASGSMAAASSSFVSVGLLVLMNGQMNYLEVFTRVRPQHVKIL